MRLAPGGGGRRGAVARSQPGFPDPAWRVGAAPRGPPLSAGKVRAPPACPVPTTLLPQAPCGPTTPPCHRTGMVGFQGVPSPPGPTLLGREAARGMEAWTSRRKAWLGIGASRCLRTLVLGPGCWSSQPAQSRLAGGVAPTPPSPAYHPRPQPAPRSDRTACLPASPRPAQRMQQVTAEDTRSHMVMEALEDAACPRSYGSRLCGVCIPQPRPGSPSWGISGSPLTLPPSDACGCGRLAPALPLGFLVCRGQEGQGCWLSEPVQAERPEGLRPHAESSHVVATRAAHESERAWELWASSKEREDGDPRATSALGIGVDTDRSATQPWAPAWPEGSILCGCQSTPHSTGGEPDAHSVLEHSACLLICRCLHWEVGLPREVSNTQTDRPSAGASPFHSRSCWQA